MEKALYVRTWMQCCVPRGKGQDCSFPSSVKMNERIMIDGVPVSDEVFSEVFTQTLGAVKQMEAEGLEHPTFFEFLFGMGMLAFSQAEAEYVILETGLGGRLDATSATEDPEVCVITSIGLDHMEYLGDTVEQIAGEKAGIIRPGVPVFMHRVQKKVTESLKRRQHSREVPVKNRERCVRNSWNRRQTYCFFLHECLLWNYHVETE